MRVCFCICQMYEPMSDDAGGLVGWIGLVWCWLFTCSRCTSVWLYHCWVYPQCMLWAKIKGACWIQIQLILVEHRIFLGSLIILLLAVSFDSNVCVLCPYFVILWCNSDYNFLLMCVLCVLLFCACTMSKSLGMEPPHSLQSAVQSVSAPPPSQMSCCVNCHHRLPLPLKSVSWLLT